MSDGSCPRCGQGHALASCPHAAGQLTASLLDSMKPAGSDLRPGDVVGEYRIVGVIGEGGMGKVYSGIHPLIGRKVAVKVISRALSLSDEGTARFLQEARALTALRHRNIVDVFAFGQLADGRHYQVMELLEGENLGQVLAKRGALPLAHTRVMTRAILSALDAAHRGGIIHRDIKPDNVFVLGSLDGPLDELEIKLLDFGLAKRAPTAEMPAVVTRLGFPMGTPAYMSPEQCRGAESIDARADVYAAGVVLYEMLTGRVPFRSEAALEVMTMQIGQPAPPPSSVTPVPLALEQVVLRALAKDPAERFETASEMLVAFEVACRATPDWRPSAARSPQMIGVGATLPSATPMQLDASVSPAFLTPTSMPTLPRGPRPAPSRRWIVLGLGGAAALAGVGVVVRGTRPPQLPAPPLLAPATVLETPPPPAPKAAAVRVALTPAGRLFLDGRLVGTGSELEIPDVPLGPHLLRAEAAGHLAAQRTLTVEAGTPAAVAIVLEPKPAAKRRAARRRPKSQEGDLEAPINPYQR